MTNSIRHTTRIDLSENLRESVIELLQARLADAVDLTTQAKQAHWNVKGPSFIALHELFDRVHGELVSHTDLIAERLVTLGGQACGTARVASQRSTLAEYPLDITSGAEHVSALAAALAAFGRSIRSAIDEATELGDASTADIFTEVSRGVDKSLWLVEAHSTD